MKIIYSVALGGALMLSVQAVQAAIALDRTRAILDGGEKAIALTIRNDNPHLPYLAQAWLEDLEGHRITGPLIAVPPVQRVEPATKSQISISSLPSVSTLPQDRESAFYFNVREIPPRSDKANVMQVALQTKIKVFYRPSSITPKPGDVWQDKLVLTKLSSGYQVENPTPFYVTVIGLSGSPKGLVKDFKAVMIAPKSTVKVQARNYDSPYMTYINDYGGRPTLKYRCQGSVCRAEPHQES